MGGSAELLARQMEDAFSFIRRAVEGLTDDEFSWEPVPGSWRVYRGDDGRWTYDYQLPEPDPSPFTTIGWRLFHVASCKVMYHEYAFGPGRITWDTIEVPHTAVDTIAMLEHGQALLVADVAALADPDLGEERPTNWGERWPTWRILWTMVHHDLWHGGEIGAVRDLFRLREDPSRSGR